MAGKSEANAFLDHSMDLFDDSVEFLGVDTGEDQSHPSCPFCNLAVPNFRLQSHIDTDHPEGKTSTTADVSVSCGNSHGSSVDYTLVCPFCETSHDAKASIAHHLTVFHEHDIEQDDLEELAHNLDLVLCPMCRYISSSEKDIQWHVEAVHSQFSTNGSLRPGGDLRDRDESVTVCPMCGLEESDPDILNSHIQLHLEEQVPHRAGKTSTYRGGKQGHAVRSSSSSSSSGSSSERWKGKRKANSQSYMQQYQQGLERAVIKGELSPSDYHEQIAKMSEKDVLSGVDGGHSRVKGLIEMIGLSYRRNARHDQRVVLCGPTDFFCGSFGDKGWGCGYRNFQMLLSCLNRMPAYSAMLSSKKGKEYEIPSVPRIQEMIERAWQKGFDPEGCLQLAAKLCNTKKWIGATEIAATLSSMGIKCELVDFPWPSSPDGTHPRLLQWVDDYFHRDQHASLPQPPLYLQHQGHSRTIVGMEKDKGVSRLFLFDPAASTERITSLKAESLLSWKQMAVFRRNPAAFKAKQYQIVAVVGLLDKGEMERSKRLASARVL